MSMENIHNPRPHRETPVRLRLTNEANLKFVVNEIKVTGKEHIQEIPPNAKVVVITTHLSDLDVPIAIHAIADKLDVAIANQSVHHNFFGKQGEAPTNIGIRIAGKDNFIPTDWQRNEGGQKSPGMFNPGNFEPMAKALEKGKSVVISAHNPAPEALKNLDSVRGGYGGAYLAALADAYILPVTVALDHLTGMYKENIKLKTFLDKPNASVIIGEPFKIEKIEGIERFSELAEKRKNGTRLTTEETKEFLQLADTLRKRSQSIMKLLAEQMQN